MDCLPRPRLPSPVLAISPPVLWEQPRKNLRRCVDQADRMRYDIRGCQPYLHTSRKRQIVFRSLKNLSLSLAVGDLNVCT